MAAAPRVIIVAGPTASGKSALALSLAEGLNGTVINADSIQCYRDLPILSARPTPAEEERAPHRLYGILGPTEMLSATSWATKAADEIKAAVNQGRQVIVTGGTGFYLKALVEGLADIPAVPVEVRAATQELLKSIGVEALHARLMACDPVTASRLKPTDKQRIARAWEVFEATETPLSTWQAQPTIPPIAAQFINVAIQPARAELNLACDNRFLAMLHAGALEDVRLLLSSGVPSTAPVMRALGAQELARHLSGELSLAEATTLAQTATRQYAKRQTTWFRHQFHADYRIETKYSESLMEKIFPDIRRMLLT